MRLKFSNLILVLILVSLTGCRGYQFGPGVLSSKYRTISVPYAEGDFDGSFTTEMIRQISVSGIFQYQHQCADLILKVRLLEFDDYNIGFRYQEDSKSCHLTRETIPVETRLIVLAEISVIDRASCEVVLAPVRITASTVFDHDYYSTKNNINSVSLGQLTDYDEAMDAAEKPLYYNLSKKIVDFLADSW